MLNLNLLFKPNAYLKPEKTKLIAEIIRTYIPLLDTYNYPIIGPCIFPLLPPVVKV